MTTRKSTGSLAQVTFPKLSHVGAALKGLLSTGWHIQKGPSRGQLPRNGSLLSLIWNSDCTSVRLFIYKVTKSSRGRPHERRVEITSTYKTGLVHDSHYTDIVLGYDEPSGVFVGVDPRRLGEGGRTGNASTFFEATGLSIASDSSITVLAKPSELFGLEYFAFFKTTRLAEYLISADLIHQNAYDGLGPFSGNQVSNAPGTLAVDLSLLSGVALHLSAPASQGAKPIWKDAETWTAFENTDLAKLRRKKLSSTDYLQLQNRRNEIGAKGEEHVMKLERLRLRTAGRDDLAKKIKQVSLTQPFRGYDIRSFEVDGTSRFVEVKTSTGSTRQFPISGNEWKVASRLGARYHICRVTNIEGDTKIHWLPDPVALQRKGHVTLATFNWLLKYTVKNK